MKNGAPMPEVNTPAGMSSGKKAVLATKSATTIMPPVKQKWVLNRQRLQQNQLGLHLPLIPPFGLIVLSHRVLLQHHHLILLHLGK